MNYHLSEQLNKEKNFYVLNSSKWLLNCGLANAYNSKLWYLTKTPFSNNFFKQAIIDLSNLYGWNFLTPNASFPLHHPDSEKFRELVVDTTV